MLRTKLAKKVLTKAEQRHLTTDGNIHSMAAFERQVAFMKKNRKEDDSPWRHCWECWNIAKKLGMVD
jgi:hypothetical protein